VQNPELSLASSWSIKAGKYMGLETIETPKKTFARRDGVQTQHILIYQLNYRYNYKCMQAGKLKPPHSL
jgi:hypothetical protein